MTCIRPGDMVAFYWTPERGKHKRLKTGLVLHWKGDPDQLAHVAVDGEQRLFRVYVDRMVKAGEKPRRGHMLITAEQGRRARQNIERFLASDKGRDMLERLKPVERADPYWTGALGTEPVRGPSSGPGGRSCADPPVTVAKRGSSHWSSSMERFLCGTPYRYAMRRLKAEHPDHWQVWRLHAEAGHAMKAIAHQVGTSEANAKQRKHRARIYLLGYVHEWRLMDADDQVA